MVNSTGMNSAYIGQTVSTQPNGVGLKVVVSGWFYIDTFTSMATPDAYGLYMEAYNAAGVFQGPPNYWPIDSAAPRKVWTKASFYMEVPPNESWTFHIRCYAPGGTIYYDDIKCVTMQSVSTEGVGTNYRLPVDVGDIVQMLVNHVQKTSVGKSDLNIGVHTHTVGIKQERSYQYVDHMQFDQAMREFIERDDGFDYYIDLTPTTRTFFQFSHKRGTDRSASVTLKFTGGSSTNNCTDYTLTDDAGACITHQTMLGNDNGPEREQGDYTDASNVAGIILEDVRQAPQLVKVDSLQPLARDRVKRYGTPGVPRTLEMHVKGSSGLIGTLKCGDLVKINVSDGWTSILNTYRITTMELDCNQNILKVTVVHDDLS
jgi:hypothetical protein